jgi:uncharacterized protein (UPF0276 family)
MSFRHGLPYLGFGLGLRPQHYAAVLDGAPPRVDWFEAISENYMVPGGRPLAMLARVRERWPVALHGVGLSIGSTEPLNDEYLDGLETLIRRIEPSWISDHLCFTGAGGHNTHDLLPLPYTEEALDHVVSRIVRVQERLGRRLLIENPSSYVSWPESTLGEAAFLAALAERADCLLLLDVNNVYVSAFNHGFDADAYIAALPAGRIAQIHLAGHRDLGTHIIDTHDRAVIDPVFALYGRTVERIGPVSTMIERDDDIPPLGELVAELDRVRAVGGAVKTVKGRAA